MRVNKYTLLAHIYFFFNSVLLPKGLLYTTLLSPWFFFNVIKKKRKTGLLYFSCFLALYDSIHLFNGVDLHSFLISNVLFICTYFSVVAVYHFIKNYRGLEKIFRQVLLFNALMVVIAIPFLFMPTHYRATFWYINELTKGLSNFPRLALLTYEASYYSLLMIPVFYYYTLKFFFGTIGNNKWLTMVLIGIPLLLSLSFGVLGTSFLTAIIMVIVFARKLFKYKRAFVMVFSLLTLLSGITVLLVVYFPGNALFIRLGNIIAGNDTSANGRTTESIAAAWKIAGEKSIFFGAGLGQIKIIIVDIVHKYYNYWGMFDRYDIPNTIGETIAIFGISGLIIRLLLEIWLFFKTKVYTNYYRLALFIFIFIYQFTGSYITNIVEYVIWILAFSDVFKQFDINRIKTGAHV